MHVDTVATFDNGEGMEISKSCHKLLKAGRTNSLSSEFYNKMAVRRIGRRRGTEEVERDRIPPKEGSVIAALFRYRSKQILILFNIFLQESTLHIALCSYCQGGENDANALLLLNLIRPLSNSESNFNILVRSVQQKCIDLLIDYAGGITEKKRSKLRKTSNENDDRKRCVGYVLCTCFYNLLCIHINTDKHVAPLTKCQYETLKWVYSKDKGIGGRREQLAWIPRKPTLAEERKPTSCPYACIPNNHSPSPFLNEQTATYVFRFIANNICLQTSREIQVNERLIADQQIEIKQHLHGNSSDNDGDDDEDMLAKDYTYSSRKSIFSSLSLAPSPSSSSLSNTSRTTEKIAIIRTTVTTSSSADNITITSTAKQQLRQQQQYPESVLEHEKLRIVVPIL
ncbi:hypothetical protein DINM_004965 [Dirofilaria immitis]|nr:hypothetical protein [Dirofilaria immitis]